MDAIRHGRVVIKQKHIYGVRLWIAEVHVTVKAKCLSHHLAGVGREPVSDLQAVLVGLVFNMPAVGVDDGRGEEAKNRKKKEQCGERSPVIKTTDLPLRPLASQNPADGAEAEIEEHE